MNRHGLIFFLLCVISVNHAKADIGVQLSAHHHYWDSGILDTAGAPSIGLGLGYFTRRAYVNGAYTYNIHSSRPDNIFIENDHQLPLTEIDLAVGYYLLTNLSSFIGLHYENTNYSNAEDDALSFYESGIGLGLGVKLNQNIARKWALFESLAISNTWFQNRHASIDDSSYSGLGLNTALGILFRASNNISLSLDMTYKIVFLGIDIPDTRQQRSYLRSGVNMIFVF